MQYVFLLVKQHICFRLPALQERVLRWLKPPTTSLALGTFADLTRGKAELLAENALLRQQLIILRRQVKRPVCRKTDRLLLVHLARMVRTWRQALFLVQPETLLRWHRELFRAFWKRKCRVHARKPKLSPETIALIKEMAAHNRLWGAERIRGELLKLNIRVSKRTIQKFMRQTRPKRGGSQTWKTFLRNHAAEIWACDFLQVTDLFFRPLFAFFLIELKSRKADPCKCNALSHRSLGGATIKGGDSIWANPHISIRDNDRKFGPNFARVAATSSIKVLRTPYRTPLANAVCERFLGSVRRECLDHFLIFHERQLHRLLKAYIVYFNQARPHQGIQQQLPEPSASVLSLQNQHSKLVSFAVLGGLHHDYRRAA